VVLVFGGAEFTIWIAFAKESASQTPRGQVATISLPSSGGGATAGPQERQSAARMPEQRISALRIIKILPGKVLAKEGASAVTNKTIAINYASALLPDPVILPGWKE
jgi:hypothetical protein